MGGDYDRKKGGMDGEREKEELYRERNIVIIVFDDKQLC